MARVKLIELDVYRFKHELRISISHLNFGGHVGNSQMADLVHDGRYQMLKSMGISEGNLGDGRTGIIMGDLVINFRAELFIDDLIVIESDAGEITEKGLRFFHRISKNGLTAAVAETGFAAFDYIDRKVSAVPEIFIQELNGYKG
jgi:acyl-CoA thioesterase FadM